MHAEIGLTVGEFLLNRADEGAPQRTHAALRQDVLSAVEQAGGARPCVQWFLVAEVAELVDALA